MASVQAAQTVLVANRGEIAVRICRAVAEMGWRSVVVFSTDDSASLHARMGDVTVALSGEGARAYLDAEDMVRVAREHDCTMVHPGYGFLSERALFARLCEEAGLSFVGPTPAILETFGDKAAARALAAACDVPHPLGTGILASAEEARALLADRAESGLMLKAVAGGGGRGIRIVRAGDDVGAAFERCRSEALASFGDDRIYAEELVEGARHIEVQVVGDGVGGIAVLGERECSLQRRQQKLVEFAPSPSLAPTVRAALYAATSQVAAHVVYRGLGTFEFLVSGDRFWFLEVNPRLQVEHTVTEETTGVDLVQLQLRIAAGGRLDAETLPDPERPRGQAVQLRVNTETMRPDGSASPATGTLTVLELPSGPGIRVDSAAYAGFRNGVSFDSLLAKIVVHTAGSDYRALLRKAYRALCEARIDGIATNLGFLRMLLRHPDVIADRVDTRFMDEHLPELSNSPGDDPAYHSIAASGAGSPAARASSRETGPEGSVAVVAPTTCRIVEIAVAVGDVVTAGQPVAVTEAMKMETLVAAAVGGTVVALAGERGDALQEGQPILFVAPDGVEAGTDDGSSEINLDLIRDDLAAVFAAQEKLLDAARPHAVAKRRKTGHRTARENVGDLCDDGSFHEYGGLAVAARRGRHSFEELQQISPADGLVTGLATVNAEMFGPDRTRVAVLAYDYTVYAGTQGFMAHTKKRRMLRAATKWRLPIVMFGEGGGGRPGDTDDLTGIKLYNATFWGLARLRGRVPLVAVVSGPCFAGNAALVACADVVIATEDASIGMGGPAMIEGGGLGIVAAKDVGPVSVQSRNGVIDVVVRDEAAGVAAAKKFLGYVQGTLTEWACADQRRLRHVVPEAPRRAYDMRQVIELLADEGSVLELKRDFGIGVITSFIRMEGRPLAVLANNPSHLAGAIDAEASEKSARFFQLVESLRLPLLKLCDTPGFMVGPDAEREALVRRAGEMFVSGSQLTVPQFMIVVRKAYGLGAVAMVGGNSFEQLFNIAWPTGHFGKMGLEGSVKLAYRKELAALPDDAAREARIREMVGELHDRGSALNTAPFLSIDNVVDPAESRRWLIAGLQAARYHAAQASAAEFTPADEPFGSAWCD